MYAEECLVKYLIAVRMVKAVQDLENNKKKHVVNEKVNHLYKNESRRKFSSHISPQTFALVEGKRHDDT